MSKKIRHTQRDSSIPQNRQRVLKAQTNREMGYDYSSHVPILLEKIMDEIVEFATKTGVDSYYLLRHYQFTDEEIEGYFDELGMDVNYWV